ALSAWYETVKDARRAVEIARPPAVAFERWETNLIAEPRVREDDGNIDADAMSRILGICDVVGKMKASGNLGLRLLRRIALHDEGIGLLLSVADDVIRSEHDVRGKQHAGA